MQKHVYLLFYICCMPIYTMDNQDNQNSSFLSQIINSGKNILFPEKYNPDPAAETTYSDQDLFWAHLKTLRALDRKYKRGSLKQDEYDTLDEKLQNIRNEFNQKRQTELDNGKKDAPEIVAEFVPFKSHVGLILRKKVEPAYEDRRKATRQKVITLFKEQLNLDELTE